jgi:hypothetical protein
MLKKYFNSSDERILREQSMTIFKEVSSGVYHVDKDRTGVYPSYVKSDEVVEALNNKEKIAVTGNSGIYANFELVKYSR